MRLNVVATVYWLFSSNRTPALGCDGYDRFPESDYIVAMRRGHAYKISLTGRDGQTIAYDKLKNVFEAIVQQTPEETNWTSLLTTANRDEWAKVRMILFQVYFLRRSFFEADWFSRPVMKFCQEVRAAATMSKL